MARQPKRNRRSQDPALLVTGAPIIPSVSSGGATVMAIALDRPCSVGETLAATVATLTIASQSVTDLQHIRITFSGAISGHAWTIPGGSPAVRSSDGGRLAAAAGTF